MIDRREFLKMMAMCGVYGAFNRLSGNLLAAPVERKREPARSVIEIWVWGGPSHLETFDPKPNAGKAYNIINRVKFSLITGKLFNQLTHSGSHKQKESGFERISHKFLFSAFCIAVILI